MHESAVHAGYVTLGVPERELEVRMADSAGEPDEGEDDVKRRFREALERKRGAAGKNTGGGGRSGSKVRGTHDRADHQRQFRRKSG
ncbi:MULTISPECIES: DUF5302 domain-containing protein [Actinomadura]|uniref:DUF5302 domain-containing protein n=1 Tax=Actinomadura TaxID=1988 RepID=UPI0003FC198F|nr:DUF5302 domain-containing protein [Actinomadura madurae]